MRINRNIKPLQKREELINAISSGKAEFTALMPLTDKTTHFRTYKSRDFTLKVYARGSDLGKQWILLGTMDTRVYLVTSGTGAMAIEYLRWLSNVLNGRPSNSYFYWHTSCKRCGRLIYNMNSVVNGYGPACWKKALKEGDRANA